MPGISETEDVITFVKDLAGVIKDARADGKLDIFDAVKALKLAPAVAIAVKGASFISAELADLSAEEKDELVKDLKECINALIDAMI